MPLWTGAQRCARAWGAWDKKWLKPQGQGSQVLRGAASHAALQPTPVTATSHPTRPQESPVYCNSLSALPSLQYPVA